LLRSPSRELGGDKATERVADDLDVIQARRVEPAGQPIAQLCGAHRRAEPRKIDDVHAPVSCQAPEHRGPPPPGSREAVDQHERLSAPRHAVTDSPPVDLDLLELNRHLTRSGRCGWGSRRGQSSDHDRGGEKMKLELGTSIRCADGAMRDLVDVVIDPGSNRVTHVVIRPAQHADDARLVPLSLAVCAEKDGECEISLNCSAADVERFDPVHEYEVLHTGERRSEDPKWDVGVKDIVVSPNYAPSAFGDYAGALDSDATISYDRVPTGEIELRHASSVYSADGHQLGSVDGVVVDDADRLTHLLLERGHLWWKRKVALPTEAISKFESDTLTLSLTKREFSKADLQ